MPRSQARPEEKGDEGEPITFARAIGLALREAMQEDPSVIVLGEDIGVHGGAFGVTHRLLHEFGEGRVRDCPISESAIAGFSVGAGRRMTASPLGLRATTQTSAARNKPNRIPEAR